MAKRAALPQALAPGILRWHMDSVETVLLGLLETSRSSGHPVNKGTAREHFIRAYLRDHLGEDVGVGTGEIIDGHTTIRARHNQQDIVLYRRGFPKIAIGGGIDAFLVESVIATIEVKSDLSKSELQKSVTAARTVKRLKSHLLARTEGGRSKRVKPQDQTGIKSYVVAYDGPKKMSTVHKWLRFMHTKARIPIPRLPDTLGERVNIQAPSVDAVFVLGKDLCTSTMFASPGYGISCARAHLTASGECAM
jgi:hypothetical protein